MLKHLLNDLVVEGAIVRTRGNRFGLPAKMDLASGVFQANPAGFGFVLSEEKGKRTSTSRGGAVRRHGRRTA